MLDVDDYMKYYQLNTNRHALQIVKYHLNHWGRIEKNIANLGPDSEQMAKRLFTGLKGLTAEERALLAAKYRTDKQGKPSKTDKEAAEDYGMKLRNYQALRKAIEHKVYYYMQEVNN